VHQQQSTKLGCIQRLQAKLLELELKEVQLVKAVQQMEAKLAEPQLKEVQALPHMEAKLLEPMLREVELVQAVQQLEAKPLEPDRSTLQQLEALLQVVQQLEPTGSGCLDLTKLVELELREV